MSADYRIPKMRKAASCNGVSVLRQMVDNGVDVNSTTQRGLTVLGAAVGAGAIESIKYLLSVGADPNAGEVIKAAIKNDDVDSLKLLIDSGATVDVSVVSYLKESGEFDYLESLVDRHISNKSGIFYSSPDRAIVNSFSGESERLPDIARKIFSRVKNADLSSAPSLAEAVSRGASLGLVEVLVERGYAINSRDSLGYTALHHAVGRKDVNVELVKYLLSHGGSIHVKSNDGKTPFNVAVEYECSDDIVKSLVSKNLIDNRSRKSGTALSVAISNKDAALAGLFIRLGSDVNLTNDKGVSPLMIASKLGMDGIVRELVAAGAKINARDCDGETALMKAVRSRSRGCVDFLVNSGADVNICDKKGVSPLSIACLNIDIDSVLTLLESGANPNATDYEDICTPLMYACSSASPRISVHGYVMDSIPEDKIKENEESESRLKDVLSALVRFGADVNAMDKHGDTALSIALYYSHEKASNYMLSLPGVKLDSSLMSGRSLYAAAAGFERVSRSSIVRETERGLSSSKRYNKGLLLNLHNKGAQFCGDTMNPLVLSCYEKDEEMFDRFFMDDALINSRGRGGETPLMAAVWSGWEYGFSRLLPKTKSFSCVDFYGATLSNYTVHGDGFVIDRIFERLVSKGFNINDYDYHGSTVMHLAANASHDCSGDIIRHAVDCGADVSATDLKGETALFGAVSKGDLGACRLLVECGIDINAINHEGNTALLSGMGNMLSLAHKTRPKQGVANTKEMSQISKCVLLLLASGADLDVVGDKDRTPLMLACDIFDLGLMNTILDYGANINKLNSCGDSALIVSSAYCRPDVTSLLLSRGADASIIGSNGENVLHGIVSRWTARNQLSGPASEDVLLGVIAECVDAGADVHVKNNDGLSVMDIVAKLPEELRTRIESCVMRQSLGARGGAHKRLNDCHAIGI